MSAALVLFAILAPVSLVGSVAVVCAAYLRSVELRERTRVDLARAEVDKAAESEAEDLEEMAAEVEAAAKRAEEAHLAFAAVSRDVQKHTTQIAQIQGLIKTHNPRAFG